MFSQKIVEEPQLRMKNLVESGSKIEIDRQIPVDRYFKVSEKLVKEAKQHQEKGNLEIAFVLQLRYVTLFIEKLTDHPGYAKADPEQKNLVKIQCKTILDSAEDMKARIMTKFKEEYNKFLNSENQANDDGQSLQKRSLNQGAESSAPKRDSLQELDEKYDFSMTAAQRTFEKDKDRDFDPFSLEELNRKFDQEKN